MVLAYLPPAWIGQNIFSLRAVRCVAGYCINCPESAETVMTDMREIGPTYYFAPPRVFESLLTQVIDPHGGRERAQALAVPPLHGASRAASAARSSTASRSRSLDRLLYALGDLLVYGAAAQRARHEPRARRLHRGRGDRPGPVPLLPLDRHQPEAALRLDRDLRVRLPAARRRR